MEYYFNSYHFTYLGRQEELRHSHHYVMIMSHVIVP